TQLARPRAPFLPGLDRFVLQTADLKDTRCERSGLPARGPLHWAPSGLPHRCTGRRQLGAEEASGWRETRSAEGRLRAGIAMRSTKKKRQKQGFPVGQLHEGEDAGTAKKVQASCLC